MSRLASEGTIDQATHADVVTARWVAGLFAMCVLLQRFAVPNQPVALLLPLVVLYCIWGYRRRIVTVDGNRAVLWLAAFSVTALLMPVQARFVTEPIVSITSWGLFMAVWAPFVLRLANRSHSTFVSALRRITWVCVALAMLNIAMVLSQLAGLPYRDWFAAVVPDPVELGGFVITYPVAYESPLFRGNAWIGLEPSMVSLQLGLGLLAAIFSGASMRALAVIIVGLGCTFSGSGFAIAVVGLIVVGVSPARALLRRYLPLLIAAAVVGAATSVGTFLLERVTEVRSAGSSSSLRGVEPYRILWPTWVSDASSVLLGRGPGSSQQLVENTHILGLLVASPIKVFFDYGLLAGAVLLTFLLACYVGGPSRAYAVSLLISLWLLQPGTTTLLVVINVFLFVTLWSPRPGPVIEMQRGLMTARPAGPLVRPASAGGAVR